MKTIPLRDSVLIHRVKQDQTESGIYIPSNTEGDDAYNAYAVSVGPDVDGIEEGDQLVVNPNKAYGCALDEDQKPCFVSDAPYMVINADCIMAVRRRVQ